MGKPSVTEIVRTELLPRIQELGFAPCGSGESGMFDQEYVDLESGSIRVRIVRDRAPLEIRFIFASDREAEVDWQIVDQYLTGAYRPTEFRIGLDDSEIARTFGDYLRTNWTAISERLGTQAFPEAGRAMDALMVARGKRLWGK